MLTILLFILHNINRVKFLKDVNQDKSDFCLRLIEESLNNVKFKDYHANIFYIVYPSFRPLSSPLDHCKLMSAPTLKPFFFQLVIVVSFISSYPLFLWCLDSCFIIILWVSTSMSAPWKIFTY